jgi:CHAT domain-containing protein
MLAYLIKLSLVFCLFFIKNEKTFCQNNNFEDKIRNCNLLSENLKLTENNEDFKSYIKEKFKTDSVSIECDLQNLVLITYYAEILKFEKGQTLAVELWNHIIKTVPICFQNKEDTCLLRLMIVAGYNIENYGSFSKSSGYIFDAVEKVEQAKSKIPCELKAAFYYLPMTVHWEFEDYKQTLYFVNKILDICSQCSAVISDDYAYYLYLKAFILAYLNEHEESNSCFLKSSEEYEKSETGVKSHYYRNIQFNLYTFFQKQEYFNKALTLTKQVLLEAETENNLAKTIEYNIEMVRLYKYTSANDSAYHYAQKSFFLIKNSDKFKNSMHHELLLKLSISTTLKLEKYAESASYIDELEYIYKQKGLLKFKNKLDIQDFRASLLENQNKLTDAYLMRKDMLNTIDTIYNDEMYKVSEEFKLSFVLHKMDSFYHAFKICEKRINSYVNSTEQRNKYITSSDLGGVLLKFNNFFNLALSNLYNLNKNINIDEFYNNWLFKQGFIYYRHQKINAVKQKNPEVKGLETELRELQSLQEKSRKENIDFKKLLENKIITKERELVKLLSKDTSDMQDNYVKRLLEKLERDEILIEIIEHQNHFKNDDYQIWISAFVLNTDSMRVQYVPLIKKDELIALCGKMNDFESINNLYENKKILEVLFKNILKQLNSKKKIYFVSSGAFHHINLSSLSYKNQTFGDYFDVRPIMFAKDILSKNDSLFSLESASLIGNIEYEFKNENDSLASDRNIRAEKKGIWPTLKNAKTEIEFISDLMKSESIETRAFQNQVSRECLIKTFSEKDSKVNDLIHISTHTYFDTLALGQHSSELNKYNNKYIEEDFSLKISSLVFTPDSQHDSVRHINPNQILTSFDISKLELSGTRLVVLSACHSGFGVRSGIENVYGFTRAFKLAGAEKVVISLWNIYDYPTSEFMKHFYTFLLKEKQKPGEALKLAQKQMKKEKYEPYYWAGFVLYE